MTDRDLLLPMVLHWLATALAIVVVFLLTWDLASRGAGPVLANLALALRAAFLAVLL